MLARRVLASVRVGRTPFSSLAQHVASRKSAVTPVSSVGAEAEYVAVPREGIKGLNVDLNWSLVRDGVAPSGAAYRNASVASLAEAIPPGVLDAQQVASVSAGAAAPAVASVSLEGPPASVRVAPGAAAAAVTRLSRRQFNRLFRLATEHLSASPEVFVNDGAVGSAPATAVPVRAISDNALSSLSWSNFLNKVSMRDPFSFAQRVTVYNVPLFAAAADELAAVGIKGTDALIVNAQRGAVLAFGSSAQLATAAARSAVFQLAAAAEDGAVALSDADARMIGGKFVAVVDGSSVAGGYGYSGLFWSDAGLSRAWIGAEGASVVAQSGAVLNRDSGAVQAAVTAGQANLVPKPDAVVFVSSAAKKSGRVDSQEKLLSVLLARPAVLTTDPFQLSSALWSRAQASKVPLLVVKSNDEVANFSGIANAAADVKENPAAVEAFRGVFPAPAPPAADAAKK